MLYTKELEAYIPEVVNAKESKTTKIWPLVLVCDLILVVMILGPLQHQ